MLYKAKMEDYNAKVENYAKTLNQITVWSAECKKVDAANESSDVRTPLPVLFWWTWHQVLFKAKFVGD